MSGLRLLMSASDDPMRLESAYFRHIRGLDVTVEGWTAASDLTTRRPNLFARAVHRFIPGFRQNRLGRDLLASVKRVRPDILWIFKGMDIHPAVLKRIKDRGVRLVNYNADHPLEFFGRGSGNANVRDSIALFDLYITYSEQIANQLRAAHHGLNVAVLPFGHEVDDAQLDALSGEDETMRACFVGNPDQYRSAAIQQLAAAGIPVDVYGFDWPGHLPRQDNIAIFGPVHGVEMMRTLRRYRLQLNVFRPHNIGSHNMRSFEVPAVGGIMLAQDSAEHRAFFKPGRDAFYFEKPADMVEQAHKILELPRQKASEIRNNARARTLVLESHYADRAAQALQLLKALH